jgi:hypothetical protein
MYIGLWRSLRLSTHSLIAGIVTVRWTSLLSLPLASICIFSRAGSGCRRLLQKFEVMVGPDQEGKRVGVKEGELNGRHSQGMNAKKKRRKYNGREEQETGKHSLM